MGEGKDRDYFMCYEKRNPLRLEYKRNNSAKREGVAAFCADFVP